MYVEYLCKSYGIERKPTTVKNSQANAILECVHQVLGKSIRSSQQDNIDGTARPVLLCPSS
jgi:hypothetical protein